MKKQILLVAVVAAATIFGISKTSQEEVLSDTLLANIEALADDDEINPMCPNGCIAGDKGCSCNGIYSTSWNEYPWP